MPTKMVNSSSILRNTQLPEIHTSHERFIMEKPEQYWLKSDKFKQNYNNATIVWCPSFSTANLPIS